MASKIIVLISLVLLTGCAGGIKCTWESQDEQFDKLIEKVLENETIKNEQIEQQIKLLEISE